MSLVLWFKVFVKNPTELGEGISSSKIVPTRNFSFVKLRYLSNLKFAFTACMKALMPIKTPKLKSIVRSQVFGK